MVLSLDHITGGGLLITIITFFKESGFDHEVRINLKEIFFYSLLQKTG